MTKDKMAKQDCIGCTEYKKIEKLIEDLKKWLSEEIHYCKNDLRIDDELHNERKLINDVSKLLCLEEVEEKIKELEKSDK